jgi:ubiquinone/menaquinone biosynthesis C-methylase UbiE
MDYKTHWSNIYQTKAATDVSWYQTRPDLSLDFIRQTGVDTSAQIIDVGAGASTLADHLIELGFANLTLLDISPEALNTLRTRLEKRTTTIKWLEGDVTQIEFPEHFYDVWHDRAVFHFMTDPVQRTLYVQTARRAVKVGGHVIVATFDADGPTQCSGLDVMRYDADSLHSAFGADFSLVNSIREIHQTPWGSEQKFVYCYCRLQSGSG